MNQPQIIKITAPMFVAGMKIFEKHGPDWPNWGAQVLEELYNAMNNVAPQEKKV